MAAGASPVAGFGSDAGGGASCATCAGGGAFAPAILASWRGVEAARSMRCAQEELTLWGGKPPYDLRPMCGWRPCGCPCGFPAAVRGACGRVSTHAALGSFSFARRRNIGRERRQKRLAILAKLCYYEDRSLHAKRLFQWSLHPSRSPGTGTKLINLYKYYITKWCAYGLNAAVERRGSARQRQTIPTKDRDGKSSKKTP